MHSPGSIETFVIPPEVMAEALAKSEALAVAHPADLAAGGFETGLWSDASHATSAHTLALTDVATRQLSAQESGMASGDWVTIGSLAIAGISLAVSLVTAERSRKSQERGKEQEGFIDTLREVAGASDAEKRQAQLNILAIYAEDPRHKTNVFKTAVESLKARRSALETMREDISSKTDATGSETGTNLVSQLEHAAKLRRNADREMVKLLLRTLPAAREKAQASKRSPVRGIVKKLLGDNKEDKLAALRKATGLLPARAAGLVDAEGINLDLLRDVLVDCDVSGTSFNGAGLQANNITSVVFEGCNLQQVQLEGSTLQGCDLSGADLRGSHYAGDPHTDPYYMGKTTFINCVVDKHTKLGHLPDDHPEAKYHSNNPNEPDAYRGGGELILKDLKVKPNTLSEEEKIALIHAWQRDGGLKLSADSDPAYIYRPRISRGS